LLFGNLGYPEPCIVAIDPKEFEMPFADRKNCEIQDRTYVHGEKACAREKCLICNDGSWMEADDLFIL
jgi:hypothetical protein